MDELFPHCTTSEVPTIPSSLDPIPPSSGVPRRRTKSLGDSYYTKKESVPYGKTSNGSKGEDVSSRTRAKSKQRRGRSASTIPSRKHVRRSSQTATAGHGDTASISPRRPTEVEQAIQQKSMAYPETSPIHKISMPSLRDAPIDRPKKQCRTQGRATPQLEPTKSLKFHQEVVFGNALEDPFTEGLKRTFNVPRTKAPVPLSDEKPLSKAHELKTSEKELSYVSKGAFLLRIGRLNPQFSFPVTKGPPKPIWYIGDGFSDDEADMEPGYGYKRKRYTPQPQMGQLETESTVDMTPHLTIPNPGHSRKKQKGYRGSQKDIWPTMENFYDDTISGSVDRSVSGSQDVIQETPVSLLGTQCFVREDDKGTDAQNYGTFQYTPTRAKGPIDFENFRRVRHPPPHSTLNMRPQITLDRGQGAKASTTGISDKGTGYEVEMELDNDSRTESDHAFENVSGDLYDDGSGKFREGGEASRELEENVEDLEESYDEKNGKKAYEAVKHSMWGASGIYTYRDLSGRSSSALSGRSSELSEIAVEALRRREIPETPERDTEEEDLQQVSASLSVS